MVEKLRNFFKLPEIAFMAYVFSVFLDVDSIIITTYSILTAFILCFVAFVLYKTCYLFHIRNSVRYEKKKEQIIDQVKEQFVLLLVCFTILIAHIHAERYGIYILNDESLILLNTLTFIVYEFIRVYRREMKKKRRIKKSEEEIYMENAKMYFALSKINYFWINIIFIALVISNFMTPYLDKINVDVIMLIHMIITSIISFEIVQCEMHIKAIDLRKRDIFSNKQDFAKKAEDIMKNHEKRNKYYVFFISAFYLVYHIIINNKQDTNFFSISLDETIFTLFYIFIILYIVNYHDQKE